MSFEEELSAALTKVAGVAGPSVVNIGRDGGRGAGTVFSDGIIVTSAHNLRGPTVTVTFPDGRTAEGQVKGVDAEGDLAAVAVDTAGAVPIAWSNDDPGFGQVVYALGPKRGGKGTRVTWGHVASTAVAFRGPRGRLIVDGFEHTALVGRGCSGGPVVDSSGHLVGINTHRPGDGLYLAIPASSGLRGRLEALAQGDSPSRRQLGIALVPSHAARRLRAAVGLEPRDGLLVREVDPDAPAGAAGLLRGDLIVTAAGQPVSTLDGLAAAIDAAGQTIVLGVVRGVEELTVEISFE